MSENDKDVHVPEPDGQSNWNFPGLASARNLVASSSQAVLATVDTLNDLWGRAIGGTARFTDLTAAAANLWQSYYGLAMDVWRAPQADDVRPGWAIFSVSPGQTAPAPYDVQLSRAYDPESTPIHKSAIQRLGGTDVIGEDSYVAKLVNRGRTLRVRLTLDGLPPADGDYIGLVTVPAVTAPLAIVLVQVRQGAERAASNRRSERPRGQ